MQFIGVAHRAVQFFARRGINFEDTPSLFQDIYVACFEATASNPEVTAYELDKIGRQIAARRAREEKQQTQVKEALRDATPEELSATGCTFGQRLRALRIGRRITQEDLSEELDVSGSAVSKWEANICLPEPSQMRQLAVFFEVNAAYLLAGIEREELIAVRIQDESEPFCRRALGMKVRLLRYEEGLFAQDAARAAGVSLATLIEIEKGRCMPYAPTLLAVAGALGTTVSELLAGMPLETLMGIQITNEQDEVLREFLGLKLRVLRYQKGVLLSKLCREVGMDAATLWRYESGQRIPVAAHMLSLANCLDTTASWLLAGMPEEELMATPIENEKDPRSKIIFGLKIKVMRYSKMLARSAFTVKPNTLADIEKGLTCPKPYSVVALAEELGASVSELFAGIKEQELLARQVEGLEAEAAKKVLGMKIKVLRLKKGLTRTWLAEMLEVHEGTIERWETAETFPQPAQLEKFAALMGAAVDDLMGILKRCS